MCRNCDWEPKVDFYTYGFFVMVINDMGIKWTMKRKLYSYSRWSSAVQKDGTTSQRQQAAAEQYARENGYDLETIVDDGISAFRGANYQSGALGQFLDAIDAGFIPNNATLYVESLDRLSRAEIDLALEMFMGILRRGVSIVTGMDRKVYNSASIKGNPIDLITSLLLFSRAHEESKTKQQRTNSHALEMIKRFKSGLPTTIKSIGSHPWWIDASTNYDESVRKHVQYWPIAKKCMDMFLDGVSVFKVVEYLNTTYPMGAPSGKAWVTANVRKLRINKAVYGTREVTIAEKVHVLEGYYPALITEGEYIRLQQIRETKKYLGEVGDGVKNNINLLAGMKLFRCGHCGSTMMAMRQGESIRYLCEKGRGNNAGCKTWSMPGELVEHVLMIVVTIAYINMNKNGAFDKADYSTQIVEIESALKDVSTSIVNLTKLVERGLGNVDEIIDRISSLEDNRTNLKLELEVATRKQVLAQDYTFENLMMDFFNYAQYGVLQDPVHPHREKLRQVVMSCIGEVKAWKFNRRLTIAFQVKGDDEYYTFSAGDEPYNYIFYKGFPERVGDTSNDDNVIELPEAVKQRIRSFKHVFEGDIAILNSAMEMLKVIHYPVLDGRLFWPRK